MQTIVYSGSSDSRELSREDFAKLGIDHFGMSFVRGMPVEVSNEAYGILMGHEALRGDFAASDAKVDKGEPDLSSLVNDSDGQVNPEDANENKGTSGKRAAEDAQTGGSTDTSGAGTSSSTADSTTGKGSTSSTSKGSKGSTSKASS